MNAAPAACWEETRCKSDHSPTELWSAYAATASDRPYQLHTGLVVPARLVWEVRRTEGLGESKRTESTPRVRAPGNSGNLARLRPGFHHWVPQQAGRVACFCALSAVIDRLKPSSYWIDTCLKSGRHLDFGATQASSCTPCTATTRARRGEARLDDERTPRACARDQAPKGIRVPLRVRGWCPNRHQGAFQVSKSGPRHCPVGCNGPDQVVAGNAEVYGSEMAPGRTYVFSQECRAAIYSWEGCTLEMSRLRPSVQGPSPDSTGAPPSHRQDCDRVCVRRNHDDRLRQPPPTPRTNAHKSPSQQARRCSQP
jgi:hypothetical protein